MEIKEIVKELEYYNEELPKEALEKAIEYKEEMIPELLKMLEYTKERNLIRFTSKFPLSSSRILSASSIAS